VLLAETPTLMAQQVSDFVLQRLSEWGIRRIFGYPGDGINALMGSLSKAEDKMEFIQVRHEEMAALMACAHAKFTGEVGVCLATSGPGAIHLLNGLYDAKLDHQPVVAIVGQKARTSLGGSDQRLRAAGVGPQPGAPPARPRHPHCQSPKNRYLRHSAQ
jgi:pyruvate dehydrogenase (quinone)